MISRPNWNDPSSIYEWIKQLFTLNRGRNRLVKTYGADFELLKRDDTIEVLWNDFTTLSGIATRFKNRDRNDKGLHPIPVLAGGPGVGKSRFLDEVEELIKKKAEESHNNAFTNMIVINTTYGNSTVADDIDEKIQAQASLAIRILFEYFRPKHQDYPQSYNFVSFRSYFRQHHNNSSDVSDFTLDTALQIIYKDFVQINPTTPNPLLVLVLGIDEFNKLHIQNKDVCGKLIHAIGGTMCGPPSNIFFIPILSGTIEGPLNDYISGSMHQPLLLPLYLLEDDDAIAIGKAMKLFDDQYVKCHPYFRMSIGDIGGHAKTLEFFYQIFKEQSNQKDGHINKIKMVNVMGDVKSAVKRKYHLDSRSEWMTELLAKAILGLPVNKKDTIKVGDEFKSYQDLSSMGILNLVPIKKGKCYNVRLPYIWVFILVQSSEHSGMDYWKSMIDYDEPMHWQNFEMFNAKFWALRLSLFRLLGYKKINLGELLKGAKFSRGFPNVEVSLPKDLKICKLLHQYPDNELDTEDNKMDDDNTKDDEMDNDEDDEMDDDDDEMDDDDMERVNDNYTKMDCPYLDISKNISYTFLNADGAVWDVFVFLRITKDKFLCIAQQVKITSVDANKPMTINQALFNNEYTKVTKAMKCVPAEEWVLLFLTNADTRNLSIKMNKNSALVSKNEFLEFYGYTYASRAQFASANEKIYINSTDEDSLRILGFSKKERRRICEKRQETYLTNYDDIKTRIRISDKKFRKLKRDGRIIF
ncbi:16689_t:CDS:2 [Funneliformis caledonium]|uniref:16689_t:CDS:1 n=1 Tax=Funneliformis caledonium TaxID=1117310 RepID=A0A9N8ZLU3_9GLOM|nr:16689_t:CDS:2 [Funneliformis caledonium]